MLFSVFFAKGRSRSVLLISKICDSQDHYPSRPKLLPLFFCTPQEKKNRIFSSSNCKYAKLRVNFQGLQLKSKLFISEQELQLISCPGKSLERWSPRLHSGVHRGMVGTGKQKSFRLLCENVLFSLLCYKSRKKKKWRRCDHYKECKELQRELLGLGNTLEHQGRYPGENCPNSEGFSASTSLHRSLIQVLEWWQQWSQKVQFITCFLSELSQRLLLHNCTLAPYHPQLAAGQNGQIKKEKKTELCFRFLLICVWQTWLCSSGRPRCPGQGLFCRAARGRCQPWECHPPCVKGDQRGVTLEPCTAIPALLETFGWIIGDMCFHTLGCSHQRSSHRPSVN